MMKTTFKARACLSQRELRQYLNGTMSKTQQQSAEHHMLDCPLCADAVDGFEQVHTTGALENELYQARKFAHPHQESPKRRSWVNWAAAIAVLLICLASILHYRAAKADEHLFNAYFTAAEPSYLTLRSTRTSLIFEDAHELRVALRYYQSGQYQASLPHLGNHLDSNPDDRQAYFLMANALLATGAYSRAEDILLQLYREGTTHIAEEEIRWYLALAHLRQGEREAARALLYQWPVNAAYRDQVLKLAAEL